MKHIVIETGSVEETDKCLDIMKDNGILDEKEWEDAKNTVQTVIKHGKRLKRISIHRDGRSKEYKKLLALDKAVFPYVIFLKEVEKK